MSLIGGTGHKLAAGALELFAALSGVGDDIKPKNVDELFEKALLASRQGEVRVLNENPKTFSASYNFFNNGEIK
jgi:hypothetical protein